MRNDSFIQGFGWLMLAVCGFSAVIVLFTAVLMYLIAGDQPLPVVGDHSGATLLLFRYLDLFILSLIGYFAAGFVASLGLIRGDQPWARKLWIALLLVEIGWALLIIALEIFYPDPPSSAPASGFFFPSFSTLALFSVVTFGTVSIAVSAWLIRRLRNGVSARRAGAS